MKRHYIHLDMIFLSGPLIIFPRMKTEFLLRKTRCQITWIRRRCMTSLERRWYRMPYKDTTAACLHMAKPAPEKATVFLAMKITKELCRFFARTFLSKFLSSPQTAVSRSKFRCWKFTMKKSRISLCQLSKGPSKVSRYERTRWSVFMLRVSPSTRLRTMRRLRTLSSKATRTRPLVPPWWTPPAPEHTPSSYWRLSSSKLRTRGRSKKPLRFSS